MVTGPAGVGKSVLVNEISKLLVRQKGYLIQGKFDQFKRSKPYSAVAVAFRSLIPQLLAETDEQREALRQRLLAAVAPNGQLLTDLVPELELIIGPQPAVPQLPRTEAQNRFHITFLNFVKVDCQRAPLGDLPGRPAVQRRVDAQPDPLADDGARAVASAGDRCLPQQ